MGISVLHDTLITIASIQSLGQGFSKLLFDRHGNSFTSNLSPDQSAGFLQISAGISATDAIARPPVRASSIKTLPRRVTKKRRRTRRKSLIGDDGNDDGEEFSGFSDEGFDSGGPFDNHGGNGGGKGWNFGGFWGPDWGEFSSNNSYNDPAFDFVYEVLSWIVFSQCLDFAFKKLARIVADCFANAPREKVQMGLSAVY